MFTEVPFSKKGGTIGPRVSPERKAYVKKESEILFSKNELARQKAKEEMFLKRKERDLIAEAVREERVNIWQNRTKQSPFAVDLVAEVERINEENAIRTLESETKSKIIQERREKAKNDIILKALSEFSDLEALRKERKAIMDEEQRLKALLALEKVTVDRKTERLVAQNAQRQRYAAKKAQRRALYQDSLDQIMKEESMALRLKHDLPAQPATEFRIPVLNKIGPIAGEG